MLLCYIYVNNGFELYEVEFVLSYLNVPYQVYKDTSGLLVERMILALRIEWHKRSKWENIYF